MDGSRVPPLRSLPRLFLLEVDPGAERWELPKDEYDKLAKVLRLGTGDHVVVLPNDGTAVRCVMDGRGVLPGERVQLQTEAARSVTLAQALPKGDKLDDIVRMGSEVGVKEFVLFPSDRTVVRWDERKTQEKLRRLAAIAREACEVAFRGRLPILRVAADLSAVLLAEKDAVVLSEVEEVGRSLIESIEGKTSVTLVVGPEGGWSPREIDKIGNRAATLGPRVLRVDTAAAAASSLALLNG